MRTYRVKGIITLILDFNLIEARNKDCARQEYARRYYAGLVNPREKQDIKPDNIYGINKLKCEFEIKNKLKKYLILRYASVYSEKINTINNFINDQIKVLKRKKKIYVATNVYRLFITAEYLCEIIFKLIKRDAVGTFNIGSTASNYYNLMLSICKKNKINVNKLLFKNKIMAKPQYLIPSLKKINKYLKLKKTNPISI